MTGRERFLAALANEKPDRLPCQVHSWMPYYLKTYLNGMDQFEAYDYFDMDPVIYWVPEYIYDPQEQSNWDVKEEVKEKADGTKVHEGVIRTPKGELTYTIGENEYTQWYTKHIIVDERDFEIWNAFMPVPREVNWDGVRQAKERIGERGIVRGPYYDFGQGSPWQSLCTLMGTQETIMAAIDKPEWLEFALGEMHKKKMRAIEVGKPFEMDLIETGGGAGSSTVISPTMHKRFCLPYDKEQHEALQAAGTKVVYHLCGGLMPLLETVVENGADALETMTPVSMGADCDLAEANRRAGEALCFIGGFDQNAGFENGTPAGVETMVRELFAACPEGGYICSPSDHFFFGDPKNVQAFADAAKQCRYA